MINISSYALAVILREGQRSNFAEGNYGLICDNIAYNFIKMDNSQRIEVQVNKQPILYMDLKEKRMYPAQPNRHIAVDTMLVFTHDDIKLLPAYLHNFPTQQMLYAFVHSDVYSTKQWTFTPNKNFTFILDGNCLSHDLSPAGPLAEIKKFASNTYRANHQFIEIIKVLTLPCIVLEPEGTLDDILRAIGALPAPVSICSDISTHTIEDMLRAL